MMLLLNILFVFSLFVIENEGAEQNVIIIGAGPSGMAAAARLLENGIENIIVLEAESRIGGRVNTITFEGKKIELGAEWCHGQKGNVIYETLEKNNLLDLLYHDVLPLQYYISSRTPVSSEFSEELFNKSVKVIFDDYPGLKESMGVVLQKRYIEEITESYKNNPEKLKVALLALEHLKRVVLSLESAFSFYDVAIDSEYEDAEGDHALGWKKGYSIIFDVLTKKYPDPKNQLPIDDKIHLGKEVTKIIYDTDDSGSTPVKLICSDNSSYVAKHVIVTPSLGVLKANAAKLFEPKLPENKMEAIKKIGFGAVLKVFISFDTKWWQNSSGFNLVWTEEDKAVSGKKFPYGPTNQKGESWIVEIYTLMPMPDSNILLVWFTGEMVPLIESMDENQLKDGIYSTLDLFFGHLYKIPKPQKLIRSGWYSNPHFRGTYSFASINSTDADVRQLQSPIENSKGEPIVQFGGEATSPHHHSTVHGAVESGQREADRLIQLYKKKPLN